MRTRDCCLWIASLMFLSGRASPQETSRVSVRSFGGQANGDSFVGAMSADGNCFVFTSDAWNLVNGDLNGRDDVFVHDRKARFTERVSVDSSGAEGDKESGGGSISPDGRIVGFVSFATNLVAGDTNGAPDVFVRDRSTGVTECVSVNTNGVPGNDWSFSPSISSDGRYVAFTSYSSDLVTGDSNGTADIFLRDRQNGTTEIVSIDSSGSQANGSCALPAISPDGNFIAFTSAATNLVSGDTNGRDDIFVHDRTTGLTVRVSVDSSGIEGNGDSNIPVMSSDGQVIAFRSFSTNLDSRDNNGATKVDVFVHDRGSGLTELVSLSTSGTSGNDESRGPGGISADGRFIAFVSLASDLIPSDTNNFDDVFVRDRMTGVTERVSVDSAGNECNGGSIVGPISANGESVAFSNTATNLVSNDTNGKVDVFVRDRWDAIWMNYDAGLSGTNGVPSFTAQSDPLLGSNLGLDLDNSCGAATSALVVVGFERAEIRSAWGADLLVAPTILWWVALPPGLTTISGSIPNDPALGQLAIDLQALELDPGAVKGVSFTRGLELILGY